MSGDRADRDSGGTARVADAQWARLQVNADCDLRRGAWYRVITLTSQEAVMSVNGKPVRVPRNLLEVRKAPPRRWTIVRQPKRSARLPQALLDGYAVCPRCRNRTALPQQQTTALRCPRCNEISEIGWDEKYLTRAQP